MGQEKEVSFAVASRCIIHLEPTWLDDANFILHQAKVKGYSPSICGIIGEITPRATSNPRPYDDSIIFVGRFTEDGLIMAPRQ
jgi:hypothetical protein